MKSRKIKLTLAVLAAMTIIFGSGYEGITIKDNNFGKAVYGAETPVIQADLNITGELKAGNIICASLKLSEIKEDYKISDVLLDLKLNTDIFDNATVKPSDMFLDKNPANSFVGRYKKDTNKVFIFYDACVMCDENTLLDKDGIFANIYLKVRDDYDGSDYENLFILDDNIDDIAYVYSSYYAENMCGKLNINDKTTKPQKHIQNKDDSDTNSEVLKNIKVDLKEENQDNLNLLKPTFTLSNTSDKELDLSKVKLKYFYTKEGEADEAFNCYYAGTTDGNYRELTSNVQGKIIKLDESEKYDNSNSCMEISFNGGTLDAGQSMTLQSAINKSDWSDYDTTNDYSYNNSNNVGVYFDEEEASEEKTPVEYSDYYTYDITDFKDIKDLVIPLKDKVKTVYTTELIPLQYKISENNLVLTNTYLTTLTVGEHKFTIVYDNGDSQEFTVNIVDSEKYNKIIKLKAEPISKLVREDTLNIPLTISNISEDTEIHSAVIKLRYDESIFGNDFKVTFGEDDDPYTLRDVKVDRKNQTIEIHYNADEKMGIDPFSKNGVFANVKFSSKRNSPWNFKEMQFDPIQIEFYDKDNKRISCLSSFKRTKNLDYLHINSMTYDPENIGDVPVRLFSRGKGSVAYGLYGDYYTEFKGITGLKENEDYEHYIDKDTNLEYVVLKKSYLEEIKDSEETDIDFYFNNNKAIKFPLKSIVNNRRNIVTVNNDKQTVKKGEKIVIPIEISRSTSYHSNDSYKSDIKDCKFSLKYDKNVFENVKVKRGELTEHVIEGKFDYSVDEDQGLINFDYGSDLGLYHFIKSNEFANIEATIKEDCDAESTCLQLKGGSFVIDKDNDAYSLLGRLNEIKIK